MQVAAIGGQTPVMTSAQPGELWTGPTPRLRDDLSDLPQYRAGARPSVADEGLVPYSLASNETAHPPLPAAQAAMQTEAARSHRYPDPAGRALVGALAQRFGVPENAVSIGTGSVALCQQAVSAAAGPGDEVIYAWRSFEAYPIVTAVAGATSVRIPLTDRAEHDLPAMARAVTERTRAVFLCSPNNPTGPILRHEDVVAFLDQVPQTLLVVIDEAYAEYVDDPAAVDGIALARQRNNVLALRTFSKAYGLAGVRVGYGISHPFTTDRIRGVGVPFGVSRIAEAAAVASLAAPDEVLARVELLREHRAAVLARVRELGWSVPEAQGNFFWLPLGDRTEAFVAACAAKRLSVRGFPGEGVRVTVAEPAANQRMLEVLTDFTGRAD